MSGEQPNSIPGTHAGGPSQFERLREPLPYELSYEETGGGDPSTVGDNVDGPSHFEKLRTPLPYEQTGGEAKPIPVRDDSEEEPAVIDVEPQASLTAPAETPGYVVTPDASQADIEVDESESARVFRKGKVEDDWSIRVKGDRSVTVEKPASDGTGDVLVGDIPNAQFDNWQESKKAGRTPEELEERERYASERAAEHRRAQESKDEAQESRESELDFKESRLDYEKVLHLKEQAKETAEREARKKRGANSLRQLRELDPGLAESIERKTRDDLLYDYFETADRGRVDESLRADVIHLMGLSKWALEFKINELKEAAKAAKTPTGGDLPKVKGVVGAGAFQKPKPIRVVGAGAFQEPKPKKVVGAGAFPDYKLPGQLESPEGRFKLLRGGAKRGKQSQAKTPEKLEKDKKRRRRRLLGALAVLTTASLLAVPGAAERLDGNDGKGQPPAGAGENHPAMGMKTEVVNVDQGMNNWAVSLPDNLSLENINGHQAIIGPDGNPIVEVGRTLRADGSGKVVDSIMDSQGDLSKQVRDILEARDLETRQVKPGYEHLKPDGSTGHHSYTEVSNPEG
jgi:hypothetical protein